MAQENPYLQLVQGDLTGSVKSAMQVAADKNPDVEAKLLKLAKSANVPLEAARLDQPAVERKVAMESLDYKTLAEKYPSTAQLLSDPISASLAKDDVHKLSFIEDSLNFGANSIRSLVSSIPLASASIYGDLQAPLDVGAGLIEPLVGRILPGNPLAAISDKLGEWRKTAKADEKAIEGNQAGMGFIQKAALSGFKSLGQNLLMLPASVLSGNPMPMLAGMTAMTGGDAYGQARDAGVSVPGSLALASSQAMIEYATEKLPAIYLMRDLGLKSSFKKMLFNQAVSELPGEQVATVLQDLNEWAVLHPELPFSAYLNERPSAAAQTLIATMVATGGQITIAKAADRLANGPREKQAVDILNALKDGVVDSKTFERAPERVKDFIAKHTANGPMENIFIPAEQLQSYFQTAQIDPAAAAAEMGAKNYAEALATGGDVVIPLAEFITSTAKTPHYDGLVNDIRFVQGEMTAREAELYEKNHPDEIRKMIEDAQKTRLPDLDVAPAITQMTDDITGQLVAGGMEQGTAASYAQTYAKVMQNLAERSNMDPMALHQQYGMQIVRPMADVLTNIGTSDIQIDPLLDMLRSGQGPTEAQINGPSLIEFIRSIGGVNDAGGELRQMEVDKNKAPFVKNLAQLTGRGIDEVTALANESGYQVRDLLAAIEAEIAGNPTYSVNNINEQLQGQRRDLESLVDYLQTLGIDLATASNEDVRKAMAAAVGTSYAQFAGQGAKTADQHALSTAMKRIEAGEDSERVRRENGWFRGVDGKWRFEISDDEAKFANPPIYESFENYASKREKEKFGENFLPSSLSDKEYVKYQQFLNEVEHEYDKRNGAQALGNVLDHPKLFAAYPDLANIIVTFPREAAFRGAYYPQQDRIDVVLKEDQEQMLSTLLHEIQHAIQHRENFATGGNSDAAFAIAIKDALGKLDNRSKLEVEAWKWQNKFKIDSYKDAAQISRYGLMYESAQRLIDYSNREKPSGVLRLIRNEMQWIHTPEFFRNEVARELNYAYYDLPKSHKMKERNAHLSDMAFKAARMLLDHIPADLREQFKSDPRTMKGMLNALQREVDRKRRDLKPLHDLERVAQNAKDVKDAHQYSSPFDVYKALAGEVEARNTQERQKMNDRDRRDRSPEFTQDVPSSQIVVMFGGLDIQAPITMANADAETRLFQSNEIKVTQEQSDAYAKAIADNRKRNALRILHDALGIKDVDASFGRDGLHSPSGPEDGSPLYDVSRNGTYPEDIYSSKGLQYYGTGEDAMDREAYDLIKKLEAHPNMPVTIYRAVEKNGAKNILPGDWVTPIRQYAKDHGEGNITGEYKIIKQLVFARDIFTSGDSWLEWGYHPQEFKPEIPKGERKNSPLQDRIDAFLSRGSDDTQLNQQYNKDKRGYIQFGADRKFKIALLENADLSTFLHETGHFWLEVMGDLATRDGAADQIKADYDAILKFLKVESRDQIGVEQHEMFARANEAYLMEGKAPSPELRAVFQRFKAWLTMIYKSMDALNVKLSDEVRGVFNRIYAADAEIEAAQDDLDLPALFATAQDAGMTEQEFSAYKSSIAAATARSKDELRAKLMRQFQREKLVWWNDELDKMRAEVGAEVDAQPVYRAFDALTKGELPDGTPFKLDKQGLIDQFGKAYVKKLPRGYGEGRGAVFSTDGNGIRHDAAADLLGYGSGAELVEALINMRPRKELIEAEAKKRMLEKHGDLLTDGTIADEATAALHNEERGNILRTELVAIRRKQREVAPFVKLETDKAKAQAKQAMAATDVPPASAFRDAARGLIGQSAVRDIKPYPYLLAERKASKAAFKAMAKGDHMEAATQKQRELLNHYLYLEATKAQETVEDIFAYARKFTKTKMRAKFGKAGASYLEQIDDLLDQYEFASVPNSDIVRREKLLQFIKDKMADDEPVMIPDSVLLDAQKRNYKTLPFDQLLAVRDAIKNIEHMVDLKTKLLKIQVKRALEEVVNEGAASIEEYGTIKQAPIGTRTWLDSVKEIRDGYFAAHRKIASLFREMDGWKDDGFMWNTFMKPINDAATDKAVRTEDATKKLMALYAKLQKPGLANKLKGLGLLTKEYYPSLGRSLSKSDILALALNYGNEGNRQRIRDGYGWTDQQVLAALNKLEAHEWDFVQGTWDLIDSYWPEISAQDKRINGIEPAKVERSGFVLPNGRTVEGGYYPIKYDERHSVRSYTDRAKEEADRIMRGAVARPGVDTGFTEARAGKVIDRKIKLDLGVGLAHIDTVLQTLTHREMLIDINKILGSTKINGAILEHYGIETYKAVQEAIVDIAAGEIGAQDAFEKGMGWLRSGVTVAGLGLNITTAFMQPLGITQSMVRIGPKWAARGVARFIGDALHMENSAKFVYEKSDMMRLRSVTQSREISEIRNKISKGGVMPAVEEAYFYAIVKMQAAVDIPTWLGAYEKYMEQTGNDEAKAIALANQAVVDAQGGGETKDLASIQRGGPLKKLFTTFYSYFSALWNLSVESAGRTDFKKVGDVGRFAVDMLLLYTIPVVLTAMLKEAVSGKGGPDDDEEWYLWLAKEQLSFMAGSLVGLREISSSIQGMYGYSGPAGTRFFSETSKLIKQTMQGDADAAWAKAANNTAGILFHYPAGQVQRTVEGFMALQDGTTRNPAALLFGPPKEH